MSTRAMSLAVVGSLLASCQVPPTSGGAALLEQPVRYYECADGTKLDVRLTGEAALVRVNSSDEIQLPRLPGSGTNTVFTNGKQTIDIAGGNLSYGLGRAVPMQCKIG